MDRPLTLVSAPAGAGKSRAVKGWIDDRGLSVIWADCRNSWSSIPTFAFEILTRAEKVIPGVFSDSLALMNRAGVTPTSALVESIVADATKIESLTILVIDDFNSIPMERVSKFLTELIPSLPELLKVVLISRIDPPLPLPLWRSRALLTEVRSDDLYFGRSEVAEYLSDIDVSDRAVDVALEKTEGWPLAVSMLRHSLISVPDPNLFVETFSATDRLIFDFLAEEVVHSIPSECIDFLCATAILREFSIELCDEVLSDLLETTTSRELIDLILRQNLFLIPMVEDQRWFRYHHLFEEVLSILSHGRFDDSRRRGFLRSAAHWFLERGSVEQAILSFIRAGDTESSDEVLERAFQSLVRYPMSIYHLGRVLDMFGDSPISISPIRHLARAAMKVANWDFEGQTQDIEKAREMLESLPDSFPMDRRKGLEKLYEAIRSHHFFWTGEPEQALKAATKAYALSTPDDLYSYDKSIVYKAFSRYAMGQTDLAFRELSEAIAKDCSVGGSRRPTFLLCNATLNLYTGRMPQTAETALQVLELDTHMVVEPFFESYAYYLIGLVAFESNDLQEARRCFEKVVNRRNKSNCRISHDAYLGLANLDMLDGANAAAARRADEARSYAIEMRDAISIRASSGFEKKFAISHGKDAYVPMPRKAKYLPSFWLETPELAEAEIIAGVGSPEQLSEILDFVNEHIDLANRANNSWLAVKFEALKVVILAVQGNEREAKVYLMGLLRRYQTRGFVRSFVDRGPVMHKLISELKATHRQNTRLRDLLKACSESEPPEAEPHSKQDHLSRQVHWITPNAQQELDKQKEYSLTNREMDVFLLMGQRLTQKEIASKLGISRETVKKHTGSLYRKLDVHKSTEAVKLLNDDV